MRQELVDRGGIAQVMMWNDAQEGDNWVSGVQCTRLVGKFLEGCQAITRRLSKGSPRVILVLLSRSDSLATS